MCGICGQFEFGTGTVITPEQIKVMMSRMVHRGPDDEGAYFSGSLGLGFRRLSIIDLGGGHQPMSDQTGSVWVVFNGEIYNFQEVRRELEGRGHLFRTRSDTEVLVHGYKEWGKDVLDHLNGMFGVAIWDEEKRQLMLARDRMGIKLLYYKLSSGRLTFASEIRPLLACDGEKPQIDPYAVKMFLRFRYTPSPMTVLKGVKKLAAGTRLIIKEGGQPRLERWWNFAPEPFDPMPSDEEAEEHLLELYQRAVKSQLVSDVPLGLLLSGGLDSGLLLALINQTGTTRNTYSVGYGAGFAQDELSGAARTAEILKAPNVSLEIARDAFDASLPEILKTLEEPVAASSVVPMYHICKRARENVKVAFVGQGPDELFGGYTRHVGVRYGQWWRALPKWVQHGVASAISPRTSSDTVRRALYSLGSENRLDRYQRVFSIIPDDVTQALFRDDVFRNGNGNQIPDLWRDLEPLLSHTDELGGFQFLEIRSSLPDELLMYADKMSMAHGLEVRVPYLDQQIVQYVERLDASFKVRNGTRKWIHRNICKRLLPHEILRRPKVGFAVNVVDDWFRNSLSKKMDTMLLDPHSLIYGYVQSGVVSNLLREHREGRRDNHKILFSLVVLEHFLESYAA
jgi:asparagine synthase (glutamine-hydrolysing)